jgi:hypothetical protein
MDCVKVCPAFTTCVRNALIHAQLDMYTTQLFEALQVRWSFAVHSFSAFTRCSPRASIVRCRATPHGRISSASRSASPSPSHPVSSHTTVRRYVGNAKKV